MRASSKGFVAGFAVASLLTGAGVALSTGDGHDRFLHSESKFVDDDGGYVWFIADRGRLQSRDLDARTMTIERRDGVEVTGAVVDKTEIYRNGEHASLRDLERGDKVKMLKVDHDPGGRRLVKVWAWDPDGWDHD